MVRIYDQVRNRPQFLVDRRVNFTTQQMLPDEVGHFDTPEEELFRDVAELLGAGPPWIDLDESLQESDKSPEPVILTLGEDSVER
jgi:hypothetical protein